MYTENKEEIIDTKNLSPGAYIINVEVDGFSCKPKI